MSSDALQESLKRQERLKQLKRKRENRNQGEEINETPVDNSAPVLPKPKFRSYRPQDDLLKEAVIPNAKTGDVEKEVEEQINAGKSSVIIEELDIRNLAPRKPDWDLKRDVAKKLERLERRTQRAIAELIRERLKQGEEDLATTVNIGAKTNEVDVEDD